MNAINFSKHYSFLYPEINAAKYKGENPAMLICTWTGCSGMLMLVILLLMAVTSSSQFRKRHFNYFYITHHLFMIYIILLLIHPLRGVLKEQYNVNEHVPGCLFRHNQTTYDESALKIDDKLKEYCKHPPQFKCIATQNWIWIALAIALYVSDKIYRKYNTNKVKAIQVCILPGQAVHLRFKVPKTFLVQPGQYVLLQCNQISNIEWHPFTVTQCPSTEQQSFEVLISAKGDWTRSLYNLAQEPYSYDTTTSYMLSMQHRPLTFSLDGPFASPMQAITKTQYAICVAAGIGITAYVASLRTLLDKEKIYPKRVHLLWLTRDARQMLWYTRLFSNILEKLWLENQPDRLTIHFYLTKENKSFDAKYFVQNHIIASRIHTGRPNWRNEFRLWGKMYQKLKVTVFCCGPTSLKKVLHKYCNKQNRKGKSFTLIHEGF